MAKLDDKTKLEYLLLRTYQNYGSYAREASIQKDIDAINKLGTEQSFILLQGSTEEQKKSKEVLYSIFQLEIISKIKFDIEDLAIFAESRRCNKTFYELLEEDVGAIAGNFYKNIENTSFGDWCKIFSYVNPESEDFLDEDKKLLLKYIKSNVSEIKSGLNEIDVFSREHHQIFRRFKHAGIPFTPGLTLGNPPDFLKNFDAIMTVSIGKNPISDVKLIPFSRKVMTSYVILKEMVQKLIQEIITNRIACIQRNTDWIIPHNPFNGPLFSMDELKILKTKVEKHLFTNPAINTNFDFNVNVNHKKEDYSWYTNLDNFLERCELNAKIKKDFQEKLNKEFTLP